ncbi:uncharacterized protein LOC117808869 [Xyrichtys novacula]|uniref:Uncharacterized protein LOC117808869 n=1 Tax=Xyrichtys novacula TaxID=13765 RepID=A0AAV1FIK1_XYRNO|nr:uncharacterized protein LOC117808869 [Xyrichtys novacula]
MIPVHLLLLVVSAGLKTESTSVSSEDSTGQMYITVFVENIASFHPISSKNKLYVICLFDNTTVEITSPVKQISETLSAGEVKMIEYDASLELKRSEISNIALMVKSTQRIAVHMVSAKNTSVQSALVRPNDKLGTKYYVPPVPPIKRTTNSVSANVTERQPFRLIILNTDQKNEVTVEAQTAQTVFLNPHEVAQIFITDNTYRTVTANHPITVIFGHTCAIRHNCTCGLLYTMVPPANDDMLKFYIPTVFAEGAETETSVLLSSRGSSKIQTFNPNSLLVEIAGTAILFRPGLLLSLIPETDFAACYVINTLTDVNNLAVILVHKDHTGGVHIGNSPLVNPEWKSLPGTDYVSSKVKLSSNKYVIWHSFAKMAVYFQGGKEDYLIGNPAPVLGTSPDFRGCAVSPESVKIGDVANSWQESVQYCKNQGMELVSFLDANHQSQIYDKIEQAKEASLLEVWIGMRSSSRNLSWYWLNKHPVNETDLAGHKLGDPEEGQCVIMSTEREKDFSWSNRECCEKACPVCYRPPTFFPI